MEKAMWEYETRSGTFWVSMDQPGLCELWLEDDPLGVYKTIEEATEAVRYYLQQEDQVDNSLEMPSLDIETEEDWVAYYDDLDESEDDTSTSRLESWHYQTEIGPFLIQSNSINMYDLRINGTCLGIYTTPAGAADAVTRCETGYRKWDRYGAIEKPSSFSEWSPGPPENKNLPLGLGG
jgi:hypothetical protein